MGGTSLRILGSTIPDASLRERHIKTEWGAPDQAEQECSVQQTGWTY